MDKQTLARTIFSTADELRGKIDASEYKNYVLGVLFYKFLSDKEKTGLYAEGWSDKDFEEYLNETNKDLVIDCQNKYGYFISFENLYSTWISDATDFDISNVRDALNAFERLIAPSSRDLFAGLFDTLSKGLNKLGSNASEQTANMRKLLEVLNNVPTDNSQDYDVLGFIYEYLLEQFASNAGKKAGEFYTPYEVSELMSVIVADHLSKKDKVTIYDPTSGSGSLLLHIGKLASKTIGWDNIKYYAQDSSEDAYNLTRMNLIMKGVNKSNISARNADTLKNDWPLDPVKGGPFLVDAVVSNPPYSHKWTPKDDVRFAEYGLAPKSAADYAFLLHDLYHINHDGIVAIVLPHGVLFRGNAEEDIRKQLIEMNQIETVIGLPPNIFYNTSIETIIVILKKHRTDDGILFVNASKCFAKAGKKNKLRAMDVKRITDAVINRTETPKFSTIVSKEMIREAGYDLNIAKYVDNSDDIESWDLRATVCGGIPEKEIDLLQEYWNCFPSMRTELFKEICPGYSVTAVENIAQYIENSSAVKNCISDLKNRLSGFDTYLKENIIDNWENLDTSEFEKKMISELWSRLEGYNLVDKYYAYQVLTESMDSAFSDIETMHTEGADCLHRAVIHYIQKTKNNKKVDVPDGWESIIFPKQLVLEELLGGDWHAYCDCVSESESLSSELEDLFEEIDDSWKDANKDWFNDSFTGFDNAYLKRNAKKMSKENFDEDSPEHLIKKATTIAVRVSELDKEAKAKKIELDDATQTAVNGLSPEKEKDLLYRKWIKPLMKNLITLYRPQLDTFVDKVTYLSKKYEHPLEETYAQIDETEKALLSQLESLQSSGSNKEAIDTLIRLLKRE